MILAVDPSYGLSKSASKTGVALFDDEAKGEKALIEYGSITSEQVADWDVRKFWLERCDRLIVEDQYVGQNKKTSQGLTMAKSMWTVPARDIYKLRVYEMKPIEWISLIQRGWRIGHKKNAVSIEKYIRLRWKLDESVRLNHDEISAIAIGTAFMDRERRNL
jgi:hypothetical protein